MKLSSTTENVACVKSQQATVSSSERIDGAKADAQDHHNTVATARLKLSLDLPRLQLTPPRELQLQPKVTIDDFRLKSPFAPGEILWVNPHLTAEEIEAARREIENLKRPNDLRTIPK